MLLDSLCEKEGHESRSFVKQQLSVHGENLMENVHAHPGASLNALSETLREPIQLPRARKQQSESSNIVHNDFKTDSVIKKQEDEEAQDTLGMNPVHVERDDDEKEKEDADGDDVVFPKSDRFIVRMRGLPWYATQCTLSVSQPAIHTPCRLRCAALWFLGLLKTMTFAHFSRYAP